MTSGAAMLLMRPWRNWQTRKVQVLVPVQGVKVQLLSAAVLERKPADHGGLLL